MVYSFQTSFCVFSYSSTRFVVLEDIMFLFSVLFHIKKNIHSTSGQMSGMLTSGHGRGL